MTINPVIALRAEFADTIAALEDAFPSAEVDVVTNSTHCTIQVQGIGAFAYAVGNWSDGLLWSNDPSAPTTDRDATAEPGWAAWAVHDSHAYLEPVLFDEPVVFDYGDRLDVDTFATPMDAIADVQRMIREQYTR